jgi:hypothetical protein
VAHSVGGTLSNTYMVVDVAGTTRTPSGNTLSVNWAFRMTEAAAPFNYRVTAGASDQAGVDWQELVVKSLGVTHQPVVGVLTPANGYTQPFADTGFTATFSDPDGASNLKVVYLQLQGAVSVSYDREHNLFFVSDQPLGTSGCAPQSAGIKITTPSLTLDCGLSAVSQPDANTLNITWHLSFTNSLSGHNYLTTLEAIDRNGGDSGVVQAGSFAVDYPPTFANLSPGSGSQNPGVAQTFSASYSDFDGRSNLDRTQLRLDAGLVFAFIGGRFVTVQQSVELYYFQNTNTLTIGNRNSTSLPSSCQVGAATTISTELAVLSCASSRVSTLYDKTLHPIGVQVSWAITPTNAMSGYTYNTLLSASDNAGVTSGPSRLGSWTVNQPPNGGTNSPLQGNSQVGEVTHITTTCSDPDGWHNLHTLDFKISKGQGQGVGEPVVLWVQFDENRNLIRFYDPDSGNWSEGSPGQNLVLSSRYASLRLAGTTIQGSGPIAPTVTISWEIVFQPEAVGQYSQYLRTEDDTGSTEGWHKAGKWVVQVQK